MKSPVVLFLFKRSETLPAIIRRISSYAPEKLYILADGPRNSDEAVLTEKTRSIALSLVNWECKVVTKFEQENIGVYRNIGEGAKWVLSQESKAIFLEDDNLPETTFFKYCDDLLDRYENNADILWICGTNYLEDSRGFDQSSYYYTRHLLPCGWASWSSKFLREYDGELTGLNDESIARMRKTYRDKRLYQQELQTIKQTRFNYLRNPKSISWDRQMVFSVRSKLKYGVAPALNQIRNIGADEHSVHGGTSTKKTMTGRFCEIPTHPLTFPLKAPTSLSINPAFESATGNVILQPFSVRVIRHVGRLVKRIFGIDPDDSLVLILKNRKRS
jgi:hypothetical protein